jgi:hypothetical protein
MELSSTSKGNRWELLHSLWIGWTFTLGFFSWVAFVYIGLRTRHTRWILWALFYATPLILFAIPAQRSAGWTNLTLSATMVLGLVSIVHAFLVRKEYLLRLELLQRETSHVSVTSRGRRWELLHSLWIVWTFTLGIFSWVAFAYVGLRVRRIRWILWGLLYLTPIMAFVIASEIAGSESGLAQTMIGVTIVAGFFSIVHAFLLRNDYLVRLENRMHQAAEEVISARRHLEAEYRSRAGESPASESSGQPTPIDSSATETDARETGPPERAAESPPTGMPAHAHVEINVGSDSEAEEAPQIRSISESYPLPIAYSWSLLAGLWDTRDRYREQLRHAENMLAFLGSVSLALLEEQDYEETNIDLRKAWRGGISFGAWKLIVQLSTKVLRYKDHPLASAIWGLRACANRERASM